MEGYFHQIGVLDALKSVNCYTDAQLSTVTGRIINGATLVTMKLIRKEDHQELSTDLKESSVISNLMDDFPPICKQDHLEVRVMFIKEYYEMTGQIIKINDIPDEMYDGTLPIARNRKSLKRKMTEAEYLDATLDFDAKVAKISAPESHSPTSDMIIPELEAPEADDSEHEDPENVVEISSENVVEIAEVRQISGSVEQQVVEEAQEMLELIPEASAAAPESTSVAEVSEAPAQVIQTSNLPLIIPSPVSPSNDSDLDDVPIGQRMRKLSKPSPQPQQTTPQLPLQAEQSSAGAECTEDPEDPPTSDLPQCDSPSNLFSLERHLGGEITKTPEKATKSVPQKIELVHQSEPVTETAASESVQVTASEQTVTVTESEPNQLLEQGCFTSHLLSFDNNKVLKIINWIC